MTDGQITNRDLYEAVRGTEKQVGALALQVATLAAEWRGMADHETRIRLLEQAKWRAAGAAGTVGALAGGAAGSLLSWLLTRH